ncbi:MAG: hypothetical protein NTU80_12930 [Verrucomicrobia bacterium]|nr:hypothetical protein [Verrucomicrobiota bacterium]
MSTPASPSVSASPSSRVAALLEKYSSSNIKQGKAFMTRLARIEEIEVRLGQTGLSQEEMQELIHHCHKLLNEIHSLHLKSEMREFYVRSLKVA